MAFFMMTLLSLTGILLIFIVLLQRGRGGGLAGAFGGAGGQSAFGTRAGDVFTRITVVLAVIWVVLAGATGFAMRAGDSAKARGFASESEEPSVKKGKSTAGESGAADEEPADTKKSDKSGDGKSKKDEGQGKEKAEDEPAKDEKATDDKPAAEKPGEKPADEKKSDEKSESKPPEEKKPDSKPEGDK